MVDMLQSPIPHVKQRFLEIKYLLTMFGVCLDYVVSGGSDPRHSLTNGANQMSSQDHNQMMQWVADGAILLTYDQFVEMDQCRLEMEGEARAERFWEDRPDLDPSGRYHAEAMADADLYAAQVPHNMGR
jgi:hypothetical protein